ncbi:hypothetical protein NF681_00640 (plasmid) [Comamonadaceae bacterium OTU4NAUVB1]|nr:hypothetical protein NF681_00640 [Comamonadaceae bacterium OTU4NAUVB1]
MKKAFALGIAAASILSSALMVASGADAQMLKQKEMISRDWEKVASLAKETNQACGTQIDDANYSRVAEDDNNQSPWAYLANATDALKQVCRSDAGKQAVQAKIKRVIVANGASEAEESLDGGVFRYQVPYRGHGPATVVKWLQANL